jgi:two-component system nitrate/nitrite response regulator NarL
MAGRILVVDDNPHFRRTAAKLLALRGLEPFNLVAGGDEALAESDGACPDGVLLDINLPGRDGFEVAAELSRRCPTVAIVLMSSDLDEVESQRLERCGASAFVAKTELASTDLELLFGWKPSSP